MSTRTVKVSNLSLGATEQDILEFFSFSGLIEYVDMKSENERSQTAFVTFKDSQGAETAVLLSGSTIVDQQVNITLETTYILPLSLPTSLLASQTGSTTSAIQRAEDIVTGMLAKGYILGKDALNKAKEFDEKHQLISTATTKVASLDRKMGLSLKVSMGATLVSDKVKEVDQKYQVSEKTKSAFSIAEQSVTSAGSAIMKNRYILIAATWVTTAFNRVSKAVAEVGQKAAQKVSEEEGHGHGRNVSDSPLHGSGAATDEIILDFSL